MRMALILPFSILKTPTNGKSRLLPVAGNYETTLRNDHHVAALAIGNRRHMRDLGAGTEAHLGACHDDRGRARS
jgi:hypothetical protein